MTEGKRNIIHQLLEEYDIQTAEDIQDALKDLLGGTIKEMMEAEMDDHLGYEKSERSDNDDYRNGYKRKRVNSSYGAMEIEVPQDRKSTFEPQVVKKRQKDISDIDQKIISMYAKNCLFWVRIDYVINFHSYLSSVILVLGANSLNNGFFTHSSKNTLNFPSKDPLLASAGFIGEPLVLIRLNIS